MMRFFDYMAGLAGCTTDLACEQTSATLAMGAALLFIGLCMVAGGLLQQREARRAEARFAMRVRK